MSLPGFQRAPLARALVIPLSVFLLSSLALSACSPTDEEELGELSSRLGTIDAVLPCSGFRVLRGSIGDGQDPATLATQELSGTADDASKYVELSPNSAVRCDFQLAAGAPAPRALALRVNYRGPTLAEMRWTFDAYDFAAARWVAVANNGFAQDWVWSRATVDLPAPVGRFVRDGRLQLRYRTSSSLDASQLDEWVVLVENGSGSSSGGGTAPDAGTPPMDGGTSGGGTGGGAGGGSGGPIWIPAPGTSWQWQISGTIDTSLNVQMYDIDLFEAPQATIDALRARGVKVVCYFSAGSHENWRSDAASFPAEAIGRNLDGWPGERWLDTRHAGVRTIMKARLDLARQKRCDAVEPDNMDAYLNGSGFPLTEATQLDFDRFIAAEAHARGLSVGLKNSVEVAGQLVNDFDWALNEECVQYNECGSLSAFIRANKAVFHVEYGAATLADSVCPKTKPLGFSTLIKKLDLTAWRVACP